MYLLICILIGIISFTFINTVFRLISIEHAQGFSTVFCRGGDSIRKEEGASVY